MNETIKAKDLKLGMYVVLPVSWFKHPFLTNEFVVKSQDQITKIIEHGIREIVIDTTRGLSPAEAEAASHRTADPASTPPKTWAPEKLVPQELREAIHDKLAALYGESTARKAVTYIYDYPDLNRLAERDYLRIVRASGFSPVVILRHRIGRPPNLANATSTREFLMILKKGPASYVERALCLARFAAGFARQKVSARRAR